MTLLANLEPVRWFLLAAAVEAVFWLLLRAQRQLQRTRSEWIEPPTAPTSALRRHRSQNARTAPEEGPIWFSVRESTPPRGLNTRRPLRGLRPAPAPTLPCHASPLW